MLTTRHPGSPTSILECPRCGSDMVVPARSGDASGYVFQLRDGGAPVARADTFDEWLCRSCALRWPHEMPPGGGDPDASPEGATIPDEAWLSCPRRRCPHRPA